MPRDKKPIAAVTDEEATALVDDFLDDQELNEFDVPANPAEEPPRKINHFWPSVKRLLGLLAPEKYAFCFVLAMVVISVILTVIAPRILGDAIDVIFNGVLGRSLPGNSSIETIIEQARADGRYTYADMLAGANVIPGQGVDFTKLGRLVAIMIALYTGASFFMWWQGWLLNRLVMRVVFTLRQDVEEKINHLPLSYFDSHQRGDILSRVTNDVDNVQTVLQRTFSQLVQSILTVLGIGAMMFVISWQLALIALLALPISAVITALVGVRAQKLFAAQWHSTGEVNAHIEESVTARELIHVFDRSDDMAEIFDERNERLYEASYKAEFLSGTIMPAMEWSSYLTYVLIAVVGALRVTSGNITLGDVTAFIQYSRDFSQPLGEMAGLANMVQSGVASAERTFELLDADEQEPDAAISEFRDPVKGRVVFEQISFSYEPEQPLIEDLSLTAQPGETIAIVGPTGAGKTTLVNLMMRFYELQAGKILVDDVDIRELSRADLRSQIGMVLQDAWLFSGTILENIRYGRLDATDAEVRAAAEASMADRFIRQLPDGYETVLQENASSLSSGERQLLTIARAFLADPRLLILDEATSSVDTRTEMLVQQAMRRLGADRTSFIIAHRLSTIRDADTILMMEHGRIVEQGTHEELLTRAGAYYRMHQAQFAVSNED